MPRELPRTILSEVPDYNLQLCDIDKAVVRRRHIRAVDKVLRSRELNRRFFDKYVCDINTFTITATNEDARWQAMDNLGRNLTMAASTLRPDQGVEAIGLDIHQAGQTVRLMRRLIGLPYESDDEINRHMFAMMTSWDRIIRIDREPFRTRRGEGMALGALALADSDILNAEKSQIFNPPGPSLTDYAANLAMAHMVLTVDVARK